MAIAFMVNRLKALFLFLLGVVKRALCCFRRRRRASGDPIPLTAVGVVPNNFNSVEVRAIYIVLHFTENSIKCHVCIEIWDIIFETECKCFYVWHNWMRHKVQMFLLNLYVLHTVAFSRDRIFRDTEGRETQTSALCSNHFLILISGARSSELELLGWEPSLCHYRTIAKYSPATNWLV